MGRRVKLPHQTNNYSSAHVLSCIKWFPIVDEFIVSLVIIVDTLYNIDFVLNYIKNKSIYNVYMIIILLLYSFLLLLFENISFCQNKCEKSVCVIIGKE